MRFKICIDNTCISHVIACSPAMDDGGLPDAELQQRLQEALGCMPRDAEQDSHSKTLAHSISPPKIPSNPQNPHRKLWS